MAFRLLKETTDARERIEQVVGFLWGITSESATLPVQRYSSLQQRILSVLADAFHKMMREKLQISDETYQQLDETLDGLSLDLRSALWEIEFRPTAEALGGLESDFHDIAALVAMQERQEIMNLLDECDSSLSEAKQLARVEGVSRPQQILQQVKTKVAQLESKIDSSKIGAFNKTCYVCLLLLGIGILIPIVQASASSKLLDEAMPYVVAYIIALTIVTIHSWMWTKSATAKKRENNSGKMLTGAILLTVLVLVGQGGSLTLPFWKGISLYLAAGSFLGGLFIAAERYLIRYASKLRRHNFGLT